MTLDLYAMRRFAKVVAQVFMIFFGIMMLIEMVDQLRRFSTQGLGLTQIKRGLRMPRWQFEPSMWDALPRLSAALGTTEGWALLSFLESQHGALDGRSPRQAIEQGQADRVIEIAGHEGN